METVWEMQPHTQAKHSILSGYVDAWFGVLGSGNQRVVVIDGFAGPGIYANGEPGSPIITLTRLLGHSYLKKMSGCEFVFLFNENDPARYASLAQRVEELRIRLGG